MEANELRIGNNVGKGIVQWIGYNNGIQSCGILEDGYSSFAKTIKLSAIKPIPLTEEWLLKFGFGQKQSTGYYDYKGLEFSLESGYLDNGYSIVNLKNKIKYVHQLQNLYFALTNKELIIK